MQKDVIDTLGKLGLRRDEATVYLVCLCEQNGLFVHEIVKHSGIKRSTVDLNLKRLLARKVLSRVRNGRRHKYVANSPELLLLGIQRNLAGFGKIAPELAALGTHSPKVRVTLHEGASGIKAVYDEVILALKDVPKIDRINYIISSGRDIETIYPNFKQEHIDRRIKLGIAVQLIAVKKQPSCTWPSSRDEARVVKMFDGLKYPYDIEINLAHDKTMIISSYNPKCGIIIHCKALTDSLRSFFAMLWNHLGAPEPNVEDSVFAADSSAHAGANVVLSSRSDWALT